MMTRCNRLELDKGTKMNSEEKTNNTYEQIDTNSRRSLKSCIAASWKLLTDNPKLYLKTLWLGAAIGGIGLALAAYCASTLWAGLAVPYSLYVKSGIPEKEAATMITPSITAWITAIAGIVALFIGICAFKGKLWTFIRKATGLEKDDKSKKCRRALAIRKPELTTGLQAVSIDVVFGILYVLIFSATFIAATHTSIWLLLILIPIFIYLYIIYIVYSVEILAYRAKAFPALKYSLSLGNRRFGGLLFVTALPAIPTIILSAAVCLPVVVMSFAISANAASVITGEAYGLPALFPALYIIVSAIAFTAASAIMSFNAWPVTLKVASEKVKQQAMPDGQG